LGSYSFPQKSSSDVFSQKCKKIFSSIDGCLGVVDLNTEKISIIINREYLCSRSYKPGSIFKIITSIAAIISKKVNSDFEVLCTGKRVYNKINLSCWLPAGHNTIRFTDAISQSCNIFFYDIANQLTLEELYSVADYFYLGKRSQFNLNGESPGFFKKQYIDDEKYDLAVGQSNNILVTPLQMLYMISVIANRGRFLNFKLPMDSGIFDPLYQGLRLSVKEGTAKNANLLKAEISGKTGTSSKKFGKRTNSWFIGFGPFSKPEIAIVIFLNYGRGSTDAAPLAKKVFKEYCKSFHPDLF
jgi:penicillin-binding protein 2